MIYWISYILLRAILFPIGFLSYPQVHKLGRFLGLCVYRFVPKYRKRTLSNLALASKLDLSEDQILLYAKTSLQNLMITCLEYAKLSREKKISNIATCENPKCAADLLQNKQSIIFFCGHQSNWEILFLEGTSRMPGVAIGRPVKNHYLYNWIVSIREKCGGTIITPKNAIREGIRALRQGKFLGIVGDQGMPDSGFCSPFFGRMAWTSPIPAILSHRTGCPILVAMTRREKDHYITTYSDPIWPNQEEPLEKEIDRMMKEALKIFEDSVMKNPTEWLWSHNRWKQQVPGRLQKKFRYDAIAVLFPEDKDAFEDTYLSLAELEKIYPLEQVTVFIPSIYQKFPVSPRFEVKYYQNTRELYVHDYRFKLVFNFSEIASLKHHFLSLSAFEVFSRPDLEKMGPFSKDTSLSEILKKVCYAS